MQHPVAKQLLSKLHSEGVGTCRLQPVHLLDPFLGARSSLRSHVAGAPCRLVHHTRHLAALARA